MSDWWIGIVVGAIGWNAIALVAVSVWIYWRTSRVQVFWDECGKYYDEHFKRQHELWRDYEIADFAWAMIRAKRRSGAKPYLPTLDLRTELFSIVEQDRFEEEWDDGKIEVSKYAPILHSILVSGNSGWKHTVVKHDRVLTPEPKHASVIPARNKARCDFGKQLTKSLPFAVTCKNHLYVPI